MNPPPLHRGDTCAEGLGSCVGWQNRSILHIGSAHAPALPPPRVCREPECLRILFQRARHAARRERDASPFPTVAPEKSRLAHCSSGANKGAQLTTFILCTRRPALAIFYLMQLAPGSGSDSCDLRHS